MKYANRAEAGIAAERMFARAPTWRMAMRIRVEESPAKRPTGSPPRGHRRQDGGLPKVRPTDTRVLTHDGNSMATLVLNPPFLGRQNWQGAGHTNGIEGSVKHTRHSWLKPADPP
jgi:hypothetical protein